MLSSPFSTPVCFVSSGEACETACGHLLNGVIQSFLISCSNREHSVTRGELIFPVKNYRRNPLWVFLQKAELKFTLWRCLYFVSNNDIKGFIKSSRQGFSTMLCICLERYKLLGWLVTVAGPDFQLQSIYAKAPSFNLKHQVLRVLEEWRKIGF